MGDPFVSIVVPVLDDTESLARLLVTLEAMSDAEIIVVNGGPPDPRLVELTSNRADVRLLSSLPGRGRQMNVGASAARGRWFVFLHADTRLATGWFDEIRRADVTPSFVGGSFRFRLDSDARSARLIERGVRWRVRWFGLAYGDQGLFVRRDAFHALGGYREWPLMEDVDLIRRLRRVGRLYHSPLPAITSARRWERDGWWRRSAENAVLQLLFLAGVSPAWLARRYLRKADVQVRQNALVVMARAPSDTSGKSRLTRELRGDHLELRRAIFLDTFEAVAQVPRADLFVAFAPADALAEFQSLTGDAARFLAQLGETLGDRMRHVFADLFARGYSNVVIVGSDLPALPSAYVEQAFDRLRGDKDAVVIGPATDGGYYLIGLRTLSPELFTSIPWSTEEVLTATVEAAARSRRAVSLLPEWYDIDGPDDLRRVLSETSAAERTRAWIAREAPTCAGSADEPADLCSRAPAPVSAGPGGSRGFAAVLGHPRLAVTRRDAD